MGEHGWHDLRLRMDHVRNRAMVPAPINWAQSGLLPEPRNEFEVKYLKEYRKKYTYPPPPPYPRNQEEADYFDEFRRVHLIDLRFNGLKPSMRDEDKAYVERYFKEFRIPPPAYPKDREEEEAIADYFRRHGSDPRLVYTVGTPVFSLWFHILDAQAMAVVHVVIIVIAGLFTLGFCTRVTSALVWFASLCYIHRNPTILFGVDTMMNILLIYMMISPCGAVYSLDNMIRKWWAHAKPGVVAAWYRLWRLPPPAAIAPADPVPDVPEPSVAANVAIRLLQIHVCIIYLMAGLSKLLGRAWWDGTAIWMTVANFEFAPMQIEAYMWFLEFLGRYQLLFDAFNTGGGLFTLVFEIGYPFLIWRPRLRWAFLCAAILLHGGIGLLMGLKTFSLMMLVMNMAFLRKEEVAWIVNTFTQLVTDPPLLRGRTRTAEPAKQPVA
jgi:hypothetical protein